MFAIALLSTAFAQDLYYTESELCTYDFTASAEPVISTTTTTDALLALPDGVEAQVDLSLFSDGQLRGDLYLAASGDLLYFDGGLLGEGYIGADGGLYDIDMNKVDPNNACFFQHACIELCNPRTRIRTLANYHDGGSGYVLGCTVREIIARW
jgi:hypothetical protein